MVNVFGKPEAGAKSAKTSLRKQSEYLHVAANTKEFLIGKTDSILTLQEVKNILSKENANAYGMHPKPHANAHIRVDMQSLCIKGISIEGVKKQLTAKEFGDRVIFIDLPLARQLIADEKDKDKKAAMVTRLKAVTSLPGRDGYKPS